MLFGLGQSYCIGRPPIRSGSGHRLPARHIRRSRHSPKLDKSHVEPGVLDTPLNKNHRRLFQSGTDRSSARSRDRACMVDYLIDEIIAGNIRDERPAQPPGSLMLRTLVRMVVFILGHIKLPRRLRSDPNNQDRRALPGRHRRGWSNCVYGGFPKVTARVST